MSENENNYTEPVAIPAPVTTPKLPTVSSDEPSSSESSGKSIGETSEEENSSSVQQEPNLHPTPTVTKVRVLVPLSDDLKERMMEAISDELDIAERKWRMTLPSDARSRITDLSVIHLVSKVEQFTGHRTRWMMGSDVVNLPIGDMPNRKPFDDGEMSWDDFVDDPVASEGYLRRSNAGWNLTEVTDKDDRTTVQKITEFPEFFESQMLEWLRTAVFYGVGSYK